MYYYICSLLFGVVAGICPDLLIITCSFQGESKGLYRMISVGIASGLK